MLTLNNITKDYTTGGDTVHALRGVSMHFRQNEFVAILGPSGCGKTTLLNIIGGLDHYTDGDLVIGGISTKKYKDKDWDAYRNHRVGFVFQSYNLIPHQTLLSNVELALTLSGVGRHERRERAIAALENVGLKDQIKKKPNQLSGGQMQRVAIARALVNDPDIILADEPTGALDTTTSVQIMEILREVSDRKLIVMVTHNPELAEEYATRIIRVKDGLVIEDSNPYEGDATAIAPVEEKNECPAEAETPVAEVVLAEASAPEAIAQADAPEAALPPKKEKKKREKTSMSLLTAFSLSLNNLMTKKARTFLTSFAGSIGIIGIALILALSNGINIFIDRVQEDALSSYPIQLEEASMDLNSMLSALSPSANSTPVEDGYIQSNNQLAGMTNAILSGYKENDLNAFRSYIESTAGKPIRDMSIVQYHYGITPQIYVERRDQANGIKYYGVNPSPVYSTLMGAVGMDSGAVSMNIWSEMLDNQELLDSQYDIVTGHWPTSKEEVVLVVDKNHRISDMNLYALGIENPDELENFIGASAKPGNTEPKNYSYETLLSTKYRLVLGTDYYTKKANGSWSDVREDGTLESMIASTPNGLDIKIVGIISPKPDAAGASISGSIGYTSALTEYVIEQTLKQDIVKEQLANPTIDIITGQKFYEKDNSEDLVKAQKLLNLIARAPENLKTENADIATDAQLSILYTQIIEQLVFNELLAKQLPSLFIQYPAYDGMFPTMGEDGTPVLNDQKAGEQAIAMFDVLSEKLTDSLLSRLLRQNPQYASMESVMTVDSFLDYLNKNTLSDEKLSAKEKYTSLLGILATVQIYEGTLYDEALVNEKKWAEEASDTEKADRYRDYVVSLVLTTETDENDLPIPAINKANAARCGVLWDNWQRIGCSASTLKDNKKLLGIADIETPTAIYIYPKDFESKNKISEIIDAYNKDHPNKQISYTDYIGIMLSSVETILNVITYVLIAFVAISLVVSSIMIGIITYISVLERIKEIGILRAVGASKGNVAQVFLAETAIVGFIAGLIGILSTLILCIPTNIIIRALSGFENISAQLPVLGALILILISMLLTLVAGLLPALLAAKKEPVEALRTE